MGIANSIENINPWKADLEKKFDYQNTLMAKTVNALQEVQERNNALEEKLNSITNGVDIAKKTKEANETEAEKSLRVILAAIENKTAAPQKTPQEKLIEQLQKQVAAATKKNNDGGGGRGGKKKDRPLFYDPDPNFKFYCSLCGVNDKHGNDDCTLKHIKWYKPGVTFETRCGCSKKNLYKWHLGVKGQPVQYN